MSDLDTPQRAGSADIDELAAVIARAFQDDPVTSWIWPDDERRRRGLPSVYARQLSTWFVEHGVTEVYRKDGRIVAGALWSTPQRPHPPALTQLRQLPDALRPGPGIRRLFSVLGAMAGARPTSPHWYLAELATDPGVQRTGFGQRLLHARLAVCDATGVPAYLESPEKNLAYYSRYGFHVTRPIEIPGGPTIYAMTR